MLLVHLNDPWIWDKKKSLPTKDIQLIPGIVIKTKNIHWDSSRQRFTVNLIQIRPHGFLNVVKGLSHRFQLSL